MTLNFAITSMAFCDKKWNTNQNYKFIISHFSDWKNKIVKIFSLALINEKLEVKI